MAVQAVIPKTNVHAVDIRDTLKHHGGNVTDNLITFFASDNGVNFNAKYKPVRYEKDFTDQDEFWHQDNCGLSAKQIDHVEKLTWDGIIDGNTNGWVYNRPRGKSYNEPYRLGDFRGYDPNAAPFVAEMLVPAQVQKGIPLIVEVTVAQTDNESSITVADLGISDYYFGAYIVGSGSNCAVTSKLQLKQFGTSVSFDTSNFSTGEHKIYVFLSPGVINQGDTLVTAEKGREYYTIPYTSVKTVEVTDEDIYGPKISCQGYQTSGTNVQYEFTVSNGAQYSTISSVIIKFRRPGASYSEALSDTYGEKQITLNITGQIGSNFMYYYTGTTQISQTLLDYCKQYGQMPWIYVSCLYDNKRLDAGQGEIALLQDND